MRSARVLLLAALATTFAIAPSIAAATTSGDGGAGETTDAGDTGGDYSSAWFVNPLPNTVYADAPVSVDVEIDVYQGIDDSITDIELLLDGASVGSQPCVEGCVFPGIVLEQGVHDFTLLAVPNGYATSLTVYVDTEIPGDTETGGETGGESGGESGGELEGGGGAGADEAEGSDLQLSDRGGCNAQGSSGAPWMLAIPVLVLGASLRRRNAQA